MDPTRTQYLIQQHFDAALTAAEKTEFEQLLLESAEARQALWGAMQEHLLLRIAAQTGGAQPAALHATDAVPGEPAAAAAPLRSARPRRSLPTRSLPAPSLPGARRSGWRGLVRDFAREPVLLGVLMVSIVSVCILAYSFSTRLMSGPPAIVEKPPAEKSQVGVPVVPPAPPAALVTRIDHAQWDAGHAPPENRIAKGQRLKLTRGLVQITFQSQATALVEGPAELEISGDNDCKLSAGKLLAHVPASAKGFVVETPTLKIVDLGTEFGVEVRGQESGVRGQGPGAGGLGPGAGGQGLGAGGRKSDNSPTSDLPPPTSTEVHVLTGRVVVSPLQLAGNANEQVAQQPPIELKAGQAVRASADSPELKTTPAEPGKFVRAMPAPAALTQAPPWPADSPLKPGDIVAVASTHTEFHCFKIDPRTGEQKLLATGVRYRTEVRGDHGTAWRCVAVEPDGNVLVGAKGIHAGDAGLLRIDPRSGEIKEVTRGGLLKLGGITALAVAADGTIYAAYMSEIHAEAGHILKIDPSTGKLTPLGRFGYFVTGIGCDVGQRQLLVSSLNSTLGRVQLVSEPKISAPQVTSWSYDRSQGPFECLAVSRQGRVFVGVGQVESVGEVKPRDLPKILEVGSPAQHADKTAPPPVTTLAVTPQMPPMSMVCEADGNLIVVAGSNQKQVYRVDTRTGQVAVLSRDGLIAGFTYLAIVPGIPAAAAEEDK